jgi:hypothetical protein
MIVVTTDTLAKLVADVFSANGIEVFILNYDLHQNYHLPLSI